jgi:thymidylate synthase (FAD)
MGTVTILDTTTRNPISLIGERAGICWGADTSDPEKNYKRGWDCITSGHGRVMEYVSVEMVLDGYSARVIREWYTHIGGAPTRLQASTRYIDYGEFEYVVPPSIREHNGYDDALMIYDAAMETISNSMQQLESKGIPREDIALLLPLGMTTRIVDKRNLRNLIDMSRQRMCNRAYWEFRSLFFEIGKTLCEYSSEWATIVSTQFKSKCDVLGYCPEKHGCGKYPGREG